MLFRRRGLTLVEVLVVIAIVSVLFSLLLLAVGRAREAARRIRCLNNMRQVGLGLIQFASRQNRFPASGNFGVSGRDQYHSWVVSVLPELDQGDIHDRWNFDQPHDDVFHSMNGSLARTHLSILACPSDPSVVPGQGNLSYVVNGGFGWTVPTDCPVTQHWADGPKPMRLPLDLDGDGITCPKDDARRLSPANLTIYRQTGLFFIENWPHGTGTMRSHTLGSIIDGSSSTMLLSENVRAGYDPRRGTNWASPRAIRNSFLLSGYVCEGARCAVGRVDYRRANERTMIPYSREAINASLDQAEGEAPWPSSGHGGGVNIVMADGHAQFLAETVAGGVYAALVSPQGTRIRGPLDQVPVGDDDF